MVVEGALAAVTSVEKAPLVVVYYIAPPIPYGWDPPVRAVRIIVDWRIDTTRVWVSANNILRKVIVAQVFRDAGAAVLPIVETRRVLIVYYIEHSISYPFDTPVCAVVVPSACTSEAYHERKDRVGDATASHNRKVSELFFYWTAQTNMAQT